MRLLILLVLFVRSVLMIPCPLNCQCYRNNNYNHVACVNNGIGTVDFYLPASTQWLQLTNNSIRSINRYAFSRLKLIEIQNLDLDRNYIININYQAFADMDVLMRVNLSHNQLYKIDPRTFEQNQRLISLDLSNNPLRDLLEPFLISSSLQVLSIESCRLRNIPKNALTKVPSLRNLNIMNNQLVQILPSSFHEVPHLAQVHITGNDLQCGTDSYNELINDLRSREIRLIGINCPSQSLDTVEKRNDNQLKDNFQDIKYINLDLKQFDDEIRRSLFKTTQEPEVDMKPKKMFTVWVVVIVFISGLAIGIIIAFLVLLISNGFNRCKWWIRRSNQRVTNRSVSPKRSVQLNNPLTAQQTQLIPSAPPPFSYLHQNYPSTYPQLQNR